MRTRRESFLGAWIFHSKCTDPHTLYLLLADDDLELNQTALRRAGLFAQKHSMERVTALGEAQLLEPLAELSEDLNVATIRLTPAQSRGLIAYSLLKTTVIGIPIIPNLRLISLVQCYPVIQLLRREGIYAIETIVDWRLLDPVYELPPVQK